MTPSSSYPDELMIQLAVLAKDVSYIREKLVALDEARKMQWESINQMRDSFTLLRGGFRTVQLIGAALVFTWGVTLAYFQLYDRYNHARTPAITTDLSDSYDNRMRK